MGVKIHLLKRVAGPEGNWPAGSTIEVDQAEADGLVAAGAAELISGMQPYISLESGVQRLEDGKSKRETATEKAAGKKEKAVAE